MLGLSRTIVTGLITAGFVTPTRGTKNEHRFSLQDLMLLKTAFSLQQAKIPPRKILGSLKKLKAQLPDELPLTGLRITAVGTDVAVRDRTGQWQADSGQLLMDFEVSQVSGTVSIFAKPVPEALPSLTARDWFKRGEALETTDAIAAEAAYLEALANDPQHAHAYLNLGAMLCESKRCGDAVELYERALTKGVSDARVHFNHAIALEDQGRLPEAQRSYALALAADPSMADAHYNIGLLLEKAGDGQGALRHLAAYRRLAQAGAS